MSAKQNALILALIDMPDEHIEDYKRWCAEEHVPTKLAVPGFRAVRCFEAAQGDENPYGDLNRSARFLNIYELDSLEAQRSDNNRRSSTGGREQTEWSKRVHENFTSVTRNMYLELPFQP